MLGMRDKTRIIYLLHLRMLSQEVGDHAAVAVMSFHAHRQRLRTPKDQKRIERRKNRAYSILNKFYPFGVRFVRQSDETADAVRVPVQILGRRMYDYITTQIYRLLKIRRHAVVVANVFFFYG